MKITRGSVKGGRLTRSLLGKDILVLDGKQFMLREGQVKLICLNKEQHRSAIVMLGVLFLALTVIGIILAIPLWILCGKRTIATIQINTPTESGITAILETNEWTVVSKYLTA